MAKHIETQYGTIGISTGMLAKMKGVHALSTSPLDNANCMKNSKIKGSICEKCYSIRSQKVYPNLKDMLKRNTDVLTNHIVPVDQLPVIKKDIFRFESHGDIANDIHLQNYVNIALKNPNTRFVLWTKHYPIVENFFDNVKKPDNLTLIYSSLMINKELDIKRFKHANKIFTVFSKDNKAKINCGAKSCNTCRLCYSKNKIVYVRERVK